MIEQHYNTLPSDSGWVDVYYWIDVFAVSQVWGEVERVTLMSVESALACHAPLCPKL